ncbi:MAG: peroxidase [Thaumarchaeota archaeon]|nr:peroxidase [Nitrososphaerota archaeon]
MQMKKTVILIVSILILLPSVVFGQYNSINISDSYNFKGSENNKENLEWGEANLTLRRLVNQAYSDGISELSNSESPNPRVISNIVCDQQPGSNIIDERDLSDMNWVWGQFISHDIDFTPTAVFDTRLQNLERIQIIAPNNDPYYREGQTMMSVFRSLYDVRTGISNENNREQINTVTPWLDGSVIYGTSEQRANELRTFEGGKLITTEHENGDLLRLAPVNSIEEQRVRGLAFFSGDTRANENIALTAINTLFVREHNRIAEEIINDNPELSDEEIFQMARKINTAIIQSITYNEFIPSLGIELEPYVGYDKSVNPQISHLFSVVAFRIGHSQIGEQFILVNETNVKQTIPMQEGFFNPSIIQKHGIDSIIKGIIVTNQQATDIYYHDSIRNFLFGEPQRGGLDLCVLDIIRARDHGIPDYNSIRKEIGLIPVKEFEEINSDQEIIRRLNQAYRGVDELDPIIGVLSEEHVEGSTLGETGYYIIKEQFERTRNGDRLFYLNDPDLKDIVEDIDNTRLSDVIKRNTRIENIPDNVFFVNELQENYSRTENEIIFTIATVGLVLIFAIYARQRSNRI